MNRTKPGESPQVIVPVIGLHFDDRSDDYGVVSEFEFPPMKARIVRYKDEYGISPEIDNNTRRDITRGSGSWCLNFDEYQGFPLDSVVFMLAVKIAYNQSVRIPCYLYQASEDGLDHSRLVPTPYRDDRVRNGPPEGWRLLRQADLSTVGEYFNELKSMHSIDGRARNALVLLSACFTDNWAASRIMLNFAALETIFGADKQMAKILSNRIAAYLNDESIAAAEVRELYKIRSKITHGEMHLRWSESAEENLDKMHRLWEITRKCFLKLLKEKHYILLNPNGDRERLFDGYVRERIASKRESTITKLRDNIPRFQSIEITSLSVFGLPIKGNDWPDEKIFALYSTNTNRHIDVMFGLRKLLADILEQEVDVGTSLKAYIEPRIKDELVKIF